MKLLKIEWLKLRYHKFFWLGMGVYALAIITIITQMGKISPPENEGAITFSNLADMGLYQLPGLWQYFTYIAGFFKFIPAFLLIYFISNEYDFKTYRQNVIDGLSVRQYYVSKLISAFIFSIISLALVAITTFVMALISNENIDWATFLYGTDYLTAYFLEVLFLVIFTLFLTLLIKRSTVTVILILVYYFIAEPALGYYIGEPFNHYLPTEPSRMLNLEPLRKFFNLEIFLGKSALNIVSVKFMFVTILYTIIFGIGGYIILKKRDL